MGWLQRIFGDSKDRGFWPRESRISELKKAFDLQRVGVAGLPQYPSVSITNLQAWHRRNELAYACIRKLAEAMLDPEITVERRTSSSQWEAEAGHPLRQLLNKPNPQQTGAEFFQSWVVSEQVAGVFYAEIVRSSAGLPVRLWPLDPAKVFPVPSQSPRKGRLVSDYEFREGAKSVRIPADDVLVSRLVDITNPYHGLAPLAVALGSVEADSQQTDYVRAFFSNSGIPSGIIKVKGVLGGEAGKKRADEILQRWISRYGWGGKYQKGPAVLDDNADFQKIGSDLKEIESETLRAQIEARICSVFGVPPLLVGAFVGLLYVNQRGTAKMAHEEFWMNTLSPMLKRMRSFLTWNLLPEWEGADRVKREEVRCGWNMSQVMALQEEIGNRSMRAREDFRVGALTLNEFRAILGLPNLGAEGDYYLRAVNRLPVNSETVRAQIEAATSATEQAVNVALTGARDPGVEESAEKLSLIHI